MTPSELVAAKVAIMMLSAATAPGHPLPARVTWGSSGLEISIPEAAARMAALPKPVLCSAMSREGRLTLDCVPVTTVADPLASQVPDIMLVDYGAWRVRFESGGEVLLLSRDDLRALMAGYLFRGLSWGITDRTSVGADNVGADLSIGP